MIDAEQEMDPSTRDRLTPFAKVPVLLLAGGVALLLLLTAGRYGYYGDELYFLAAGHHLAWGYADQQPMLPLLAVAMDSLFPGSLVGMRIPSILVISAGVVVAALIARELGADRRAQTLTAATWAICPQFLSSGHVLVTNTIDPFLWALIIWLVIRWVRLHHESINDDRLLLWAGIVTAVAIQNKFLIAGFWIVAVIALLIVGPRAMVRRPLLWVGGAITVISTVPTLVWQASNGWPMLDFVGAVSEDSAHFGGWLFIPRAVVFAGVAVGGVLLCYGTWRLLRSPELRHYRFLGWTTVGLAVMFNVGQGRFYYIAGCYVIAWAAAMLELQRRREAKFARGQRARSWHVWTAYLLSAVIALYWLPVKPTSWLMYVDFVNTGSVGWPEMTQDVADALHTLPPEQRSATAVVTGGMVGHWLAGGIYYYGPEKGIFDVYSPHRGYSFLGQPPENIKTVVYVGKDVERLRGHFATLRQVSSVQTETGVSTFVENEPIWIAKGPGEPWSQLWPQLRYM